MGSTSDIISGINYVASQTGNRVASMSLGGGFSQASNDAVNALVQSGVPLAIAAGNSNADTCRFSPASAELPIAVGSTTQGDVRSAFSNYGPCTDIFAPGSDITGATNIPGQYVTGSGTSMATPHVAGVLAIMRSKDATISPEQAKREIVTNGLENVLKDVRNSPNVLLHVDCEN